VREKVPDLIGAGLLMALGAAFAVGAASNFQLFGEGGRIGSGFMPFAAGVSLVVFGAMVGGEALLGRRPEGAGQLEDEAGGGSEEGSRYTVAVVFGLTLAAVLLIPVLGFLVSFGLLVFALVAFVEEGRLLLGAGMGIVAVFLTWLVFVFFLRIPLPGGLLGIGG
jgi:hypothetical protein